MIKKLLLVTSFLSHSLIAIPPNSIKLLESPADNVVVPSCFGEIKDEIIWLNPNAQCPLQHDSFQELIKEQHEKNLPFILAASHVVTPRGACVWQMYEADALNRIRYDKDYLFDLVRGEALIVNYEMDPRTKNTCERIDYYLLAPDAESFVYIGDSSNLYNIKEKLLKSFGHLEQDASKLNFYAMLFDRGKQVTKDLDAARRFYAQAAQLGYLDATYNLSIMYADGEGGIQDLEEAKKLLEILVNFNDVSAMFSLGKIYEKEQNLFLAMEYYEKAANFGHLDAKKLLEDIATLDYANFMFFLGRQYDAEQNFFQAVKHYEQAANLGHPRAKFNLGLKYREMDSRALLKFGPRFYLRMSLAYEALPYAVQSKNLIREAANLGDPRAINFLKQLNKSDQNN